MNGPKSGPMNERTSSLRPWLCLLGCLLAMAGCSSPETRSYVTKAAYDLRDADSDGVINVRDSCAATPGAAVIDRQGCAQWQRVERQRDFVFEFAMNRDVLLPEHQPALDAAVRLAGRYPQARIGLVGDTSPEGSDAYNHALGLRRAQAVTNALVSRGVDPSRIAAFVYDDTPMQALLKQRARRTIVRLQYVEEGPAPAWTIYSVEAARDAQP
ncbi:OmpA family protein [Uliginosibacterium sp. H1]|uniref:OmpA family protein n=1 Tax=Uliginosibacterium sp. H1 TaxID=3114757 RepID=UPI002E17D5EB|nr:OmpA family protein [Uliginosibacterium sp. H1]